MHTVRIYHCGCMPDEERFCQLANVQVRQQQGALEDLVDAEGLRRLKLQRQEAWSQGWLNEHFALQVRLGKYEDVVAAGQASEGFDGDEDPRAWGGNNG